MKHSGISIFDVQELVDLVIDFLASSRLDLYATALVATSWVSRSQYHIFRDVQFDFARALDNGLAESLRASSPFASTVRKALVQLNYLHLELFSDFDWVNLEEIIFMGASDVDESVELSCVPLVQKVLGFQGLRRIHISGGFSSTNTLTKYFDNCSTRIQSLLLSARIPPTSKITEVPDEGSSCTGKIDLCHFGISLSCYRWITSPQCPFNISRISSVDVWAFEWPLFARELAPRLNRLRSLTLLDLAGSPIDVSMFPVLDTLHVWINAISAGVPQLITTLSRLHAKNTLRRLTLSFWDNTFRHGDKLIQFDHAITTLSTVESLTRVEIFSTPWLIARELETVRPLFPNLAANGRLFLVASEGDLLTTVHVA
ncbi:hypothetical protein MSAN_01305800 [Mycena sanguinolenta]|uniref:Uncharacterized protein n=1 Tax=Mycena sanguinolenta TaxID=230812 RepID=A0A8H7D2L4_9AGAR|nr:hypothetical protein MSAN_01305800 [Mycena sanguinolenta]